jgi:hypothetical protein
MVSHAFQTMLFAFRLERLDGATATKGRFALFDGANMNPSEANNSATLREEIKKHAMMNLLSFARKQPRAHTEVCKPKQLNSNPIYSMGLECFLLWNFDHGPIPMAILMARNGARRHPFPSFVTSFKDATKHTLGISPRVLAWGMSRKSTPFLVCVL